MRRYVLLSVLVAAIATADPGALAQMSAVQRQRMMVRYLEPSVLSESIQPIVAADIAGGAGIFEYCLGPFGFGWPVIGVGQDRTIQVGLLDSAGQGVFYSRIQQFCNWDSVVSMTSPNLDPTLETHNVATSKLSEKVCFTWVRTDTTPMTGCFRLSSDGGTNWTPATELPLPEAYGGDTLASFHPSSLYPFYDRQDRLHIVAAVHPIVRDTGFVMPAEIWHWCPDNMPQWSWIHSAGCAPEHLLGSVGYDALYAGRPSIGTDNDDDLFVVWEQFDSSNVEPLTGLLRAEVLLAWSNDNGLWWTPPTYLTEPSSASSRFPCIGDLSFGTEPDTLFVAYVADQVAGFSPLGQGRATVNPAIALKVGLGWYPFVRSDTVGGTTCDLQHTGPARKMAAISPGYGVNTAWMHSCDTSGRFPDLNMRYNFYDFASRSWNWIDPEFVWSGVNVFTERAGFGALDCDPWTGAAVVSAHLHPQVGAVAEGRETRPARQSVAATIVRGLLWLDGLGQGSGHDSKRRTFRSCPYAPVMSRAVLLDISGRRVMELRAGANDVSRLAPGVYFVRQATGDSTQETGLRKVIIAR